MYAIRMWLRQLEWHAALYRSAPTAGEDEVQLIPSASARLNDIERVVRYLLVDLRGWVTLVNFTATRNVRNKFTSDQVKKAFEMLRDKGIVKLESSHRSRGKAKMTTKKRQWSEITADEGGEAAKFLKRLRVNRDCFE